MMQKFCLTIGLVFSSLCCTTTDENKKYGLIRQRCEAERVRRTLNSLTEEESASAFRRESKLLIKRLGDDEFRIRSTTCEEIENLLRTSASVIFDVILSELEKELLTPEDEETRYAIECIAYSYIKWRIKGAALRKFPHIMEMLSSSDVETRRGIAKELGRWKHPAAAGTLTVLLNDDWRVRIKTVEALGYLASEEAVEPLIRLL